MSKLKLSVTAGFGGAVIASGLYRFLSAEGGEEALGFGLVMGTLALAAAYLLGTKRPRIGCVMAGIAVAFVGGWFVYESFIEKGWGHGDLRMHLMIILAIAEAVVLSLPVRSPQA